MRGRPQLPIGHFGEIGYSKRLRKNGEVTHYASCSFRDFDGVTRRVAASAKSRGAAGQALKNKLADRRQLGTGEITPETKLRVLAEEWYLDKLTEGLAYRTTERQRQVLDTYVLGALGELKLREATTGRLDRYIRAIAQNIGAPTANIVKGVLSGIMGMAARYDAVDTNPVQAVSVPKVESLPIRALTVDEFKAMRRHAQMKHNAHTDRKRLALEQDARSRDSRNRSQTMLDIIDALIATGIRPGEVIAIRLSRLDLTSEVPSVRIDSTVIRIKGQGLIIQEHTKAKDIRVLALPQFAVDLFNRLVSEHVPNKWGVVFMSTVGTLIDPRNMRKIWNDTFAGSEFEWVTPKTLRKAVATIIDGESGSKKAADQMGHASERTTKKHYIQPSRKPVDERQTISRFRDT